MNDHIITLTNWVATLIDSLVAGGVSQFVICPGSRSTPIALAAARHPQARVWMQLDERSAGFFALGLARASGAPAALVCTSGTAAANFLPAVAEADLARVPLIALTADRPPELRDNGAPQTIDQVRLFGTRTRWFSDLPTPAADLLGYLRAAVARSIAASLGHPAGPVHLNCPFREPLVPDRALLAEIWADQGTGGPGDQGTGGSYGRTRVSAPGDTETGGHQGVGDEDIAGTQIPLSPPPSLPLSTLPSRRTLAPAALADLAAWLGRSRRGLIVCGPECPPDLAGPVARLADRLGFPILADPLSGLRCGPHERRLVLGAYDAFLRDPAFVERYGPDLVIRFGAMPTAKPFLLYLQRHPGCPQLVVDEGAGWREPTSLNAAPVYADAAWLCDAIDAWLADQGHLRPPPPNQTSPGVQNSVESLTKDEGPMTKRLALALRPWSLVGTSNEMLNARAGAAWLAAWLAAERAAQQTIAAHLAAEPRLSEPGVFAQLAGLLPDGATLFVGNSMPVRDLDTFFPPGERRVRIMGNRGANGIDGLVSTALGAAAAGATPLVLVLGDLSLYHDSNGLLAAKLHQLDATVVLINNDGGGIFSFLPQSSEADAFELLFGTPHGLDFRPLAELYGARYTRIDGHEAFRAAVGAGLAGRGLHLVEVRTDRAQNVADHRAIWPKVSAALREAGVI